MNGFISLVPSCPVVHMNGFISWVASCPVVHMNGFMSWVASCPVVHMNGFMSWVASYASSIDVHQHFLFQNYMVNEAETACMFPPIDEDTKDDSTGSDVMSNMAAKKQFLKYCFVPYLSISLIVCRSIVYV